MVLLFLESIKSLSLEAGLRVRLIAGTAAGEAVLVSGLLVGAFTGVGVVAGDGVVMKALSKSGYSKFTVEKRRIYQYYKHCIH